MNIDPKDALYFEVGYAEENCPHSETVTSHSGAVYCVACAYLMGY